MSDTRGYVITAGMYSVLIKSQDFFLNLLSQLSFLLLVDEETEEQKM